MVFLKEFFEKVDFEKIRTTKKREIKIAQAVTGQWDKYQDLVC